MTKEELLLSVPQVGRVEWLSYRPAKNGLVEVVDAIELEVEAGILDDHYAGKSGKRQVTLIQAEHLPVIAALLGKPTIDPAWLRRNIVVSGINLLAMRERTFQVGADIVLQGTGHCHPCSKMEKILGSGGFHAMRGHGGITARVIRNGRVVLGDQVTSFFAQSIKKM